MSDGQWVEPLDLKCKIWELKCGPVFAGSITSGWFGNLTGYRPTLNGENLGIYHELPDAKARVEWEIYNCVRLMMPGYRAVMERRVMWEHGGSGPPAERGQLGKGSS